MKMYYKASNKVMLTHFIFRNILSKSVIVITTRFSTLPSSLYFRLNHYQSNVSLPSSNCTYLTLRAGEGMGVHNFFPGYGANLFFAFLLRLHKMQSKRMIPKRFTLPTP